ncbi:MAG: hypothetical protein NZZ60_05325 [Bacteroidia bacterium]|nr:hypothetical protein [Bacteroidia bacterium]MCX7652824.1 hypothetical protein [Bacteroidia bacterium]MDW8415932.1 hypothetical protein [Bacteroidia bacterium]
MRLLYCLTILWAQSPVDSIYGLLGYSLEMPQSAFRGLIPKGSFQRKVWFRSSSDSLWEGIRLAEVKYAFYKGKLHTIQLRIEGAEASAAALVLLETYFGKGKQDGYAPRYRWIGQKAVLLYDQNILTRNTEIRLESLILQQELERDVYRDLYNR